jgi:hypothetical protein
MLGIGICVLVAAAYWLGCVPAQWQVAGKENITCNSLIDHRNIVLKPRLRFWPNFTVK